MKISNENSGRDMDSLYNLINSKKEAEQKLEKFKYSTNAELIDPLKDKHPPLYKNLQKYVQFDLSVYNPCLYDAHNIADITKKLITSLLEKKFIYDMPLKIEI